VTYVEHAPTLTKDERRSRIRLVALTASAFGPYLLPGVRTEQAAVYGLLILVFLSMRWLTLKPVQHGWAVMALMATQILIAIAGYVFPPSRNPQRGPGDPISGLDNVILPLAVIVLVLVLWGRPEQRPMFLKAVCLTVTVAACGNACLAYLSMVTDLSSVLSLFWSSDASTANITAYELVQTERYSGIFNQPAEGGEFYSIALLAAIYRLREKPWTMIAAAIVITIGGLLTVSKVFLFIGIPLGLWHMFAVPGRRPGRYATLAVIAFAGLCISAAGYGLDYFGLNLPMQFFGPGEKNLDLFTAGRIGGQSTVTTGWDSILRFSPLAGYGAAGLAIPYDNGWLEAMAIGGILGTIAYSLIFVALFLVWVHRRKSLGRAQSMLAGGLLLIAVGTSLGLPGTTANRVATVFWVLITLLLLARPATATSDDATASQLSTSSTG
jgi:hypothetical protein